MAKNITLSPVSKIQGEFTPPGDKSISHRALMLGALAEGKTVIRGLLRGEDCLHTWSALKAMGIDIEENGTEIIVHGKGLGGLKKPNDVLDMGNSGTSMRLMSGILAGQPFSCILDGDASLRKRPMQRIIEPLTLMGAKISGNRGGSFAPLSINGAKLKPIQYTLKQASAQVKSAILLAGMFALGITQITEPGPSRDHTEKMLMAMGVKIEHPNNYLTISLQGQQKLQGIELNVPGDFSSAAFFVAAALIVPNSSLTIKNVGLNPTRTGFLEVVRDMMGGDIHTIEENTMGEPVGDLRVKSSNLQGITVQGDIVPRMIDEFPIFGVLAAVAKGETVIRDAAELRVKESDRISNLAAELRKAGVTVEEYPDGMRIQGGTKLKGAVFNSHGDHRLAMAMSIASLVADGKSKIENVDCVQTSFPNFFELLKYLSC